MCIFHVLILTIYLIIIVLVFLFVLLLVFQILYLVIVLLLHYSTIVSDLILCRDDVSICIAHAGLYLSYRVGPHS